MQLRAPTSGCQFPQNPRAGPTLPARRPRRSHLAAAAQGDDSQRDSAQKPGFTLKWVPAILTDDHPYAVGVLATATVAKLVEVAVSGVASAWDKDMRPAIDASPENLQTWKATMREAVEGAREQARANLSSAGANMREAWAELQGGVDYCNAQVAKEAELGAANWKKTSEAIKAATAPLDGAGADGSEGPDVVALLAEAEQEGAQRLKELGQGIFGRKEGLPTGWGGQLPGLPGLSGENKPAAAPAAAPAAETKPEKPTPAAPAAAAAAVEEKKEEKKEEKAPAPAPAQAERKGLGSAAMAAVAKLTGRVYNTTQEAVKEVEEKAAEAKTAEEKAPSVPAAVAAAPTPAPPSPPPPPPAKTEAKPVPEPVKATQEEKKVVEEAQAPVAVATTPAPAPAPAKPALDPSLDEATKGGRHISMLTAPMSTDAAAAAAAGAGTAALGWSSNSGSGSTASPSTVGVSAASVDALRAVAAASAATPTVGGGGGDGGSSGGGGGGGGDGGKGDNDGSSSSPDSDWNPWLLFLLTAVVAGQTCYTQIRQNQAAGTPQPSKSK